MIIPIDAMQLYTATNFLEYSMHLVLIKKHRDRTKNVFDYDKEITKYAENVGKDKYYNLMEFFTKGLKKMLIICII